MPAPAPRDYAKSGLTIQEAMVDLAERYPDKQNRPDHILWHGLRVKTWDTVAVPHRGRIRGEFIAAKTDTRQGFDMKLEGWFILAKGERLSHLRTWKDDRLEDQVEYPFVSRDGVLFVWNVYEMKYPGGQIIEEKLTGNAGFWVEHVSDDERVYHCSHGMAAPPDFESLVFRLRLLP